MTFAAALMLAAVYPAGEARAQSEECNANTPGAVLAGGMDAINCRAKASFDAQNPWAPGALPECAGRADGTVGNEKLCWCYKFREENAKRYGSFYTQQACWAREHRRGFMVCEYTPIYICPD